MKKFLATFSAALLLTAACSLPLISHAGLGPLMQNQPDKDSISGMLQGVMPAVVNISAQGEIAKQVNPFAEPGDNDYGRPTPPRKFEALGSGVIMDSKNGYIITNAHVLRDTDIINVTLSDGRVLPAKIIGMDPPSDVAIIQVKADKLTQANMGDSDKLKVGDFVAAIGNPFGLSQTVTSGIISALQRNTLGIEGYENFIQTDASINPGNSGGALINMHGELIGINTAILAPGGGNVGIGFAIPINMARSVMGQIIKYGDVSRGLMGVIVQDFTPALASAFNLPQQTGGLVAQVSPYSPAALAGIKAGDLITAVNDKPIKNAGEVKNTVGLMRVGSHITLTIIRDGKTMTISMITADPKQYLEVSEENNPFLFGVALRNFDEATPTLGRVAGVQVTRIGEKTMAWRAGVRPGDVILSANQTPVTTVTQLQAIAQKSKQQLLLNILRGDSGSAFLVIK